MSAPPEARYARHEGSSGNSSSGPPSAGPPDAATGRIDLVFTGAWLPDVGVLGGRKVQVLSARQGDYIIACLAA